MQTKMVQGQFIVAEYDTGVILDTGHVSKVLNASKIKYFLKNMLKIAYFKLNMVLLAFFRDFEPFF